MVAIKLSHISRHTIIFVPLSLVHASSYGLTLFLRAEMGLISFGIFFYQ